jgi:lipopolysaccharide cholinephosphotransferase
MSIKFYKIMNFDLLFVDNRETGETRIRQCQLVMLRMLKILDYLCIKYQIKYFLTGGTLLGAMRHAGFIPWDDDLDIGMTRDNYEKFTAYAVPELPADIFFQNIQTDIHYPVFDYAEARLRDKYSSYIRKENKWHEGLQIDIFVYDRSFLPNNFLIIAQNMLVRLLRNNEKRVKVLKWITRHSPLHLVYASSYLQNLGMWKYGTYIKEKEYSTLQRTKFEDIEVYIPTGWHTYLKRQYGNYMQFPPVERQNGHFSSIETMPDPFTPCRHTEILYWKERT